MEETVYDAITAVLMLGGALMSLAAAIGLMRFPDLLSRMHAATKPQVLGLLLFLLALAVEFRSWKLLPVLAVVWIFMLLTAPVSAHMVGRAGYRTKHLRPELLVIDELDDVVERAQRLLREAEEEVLEDDEDDPQVDDDPGHTYTGELDDDEMLRSRGTAAGGLNSNAQRPGQNPEG
ncbi:Na+/H+ antiporter subunit G [Arthrobacter yangruifuii]|uniref:Na+/H+ antiporter subunit G n=1 Tax=Arthrobacter yangruifuii TaxID=2606616 RepID=A0A5N6MT48_9MICC|nr:Na+/H+ antiporter subunit G [Arthrobacter yangruifuii]